MADFEIKFDVQKPEVSSVRSLVYTVECAKKHKNRTVLFHIVYALVCAFLLFLTSSESSLLTLLCAVAVPGMYVYTLLYSPAFLRPLPAALSLGGFLVKLVFSGKIHFMTAASSVATLLMCILVSVVLAIGVVKGWSKIKMLTAVTAVITAVFIVLMLAFTASQTGSISAKNMAGLFDNFYNDFVDEYMKSTEAAITEEVYKSAASALPTEEPLTRTEFLDTLHRLLTDSRKIVKSLIPSAVITAFLIFAYAVIGAFSVTVRIFHINVFVCVMDEFWTYRIPSAALRIYDSLIFVYFLASIFNFPENFRLSLINLFLIMTLPVTVSCIGCLYGFLTAKSVPKALAVIICAAVIILSVSILGLWSVILIAVFANSILRYKDMHESAKLHETMAYHAEYAKNYREYREQKNKDENSNENKDENNSSENADEKSHSGENAGDSTSSENKSDE